jgi:dipeptidase
LPRFFPCTVILVTKGASKTGKMLLAHTDDNLLDDQRIVYVPALDHADGSKRPISYKYWGYPRYVGLNRGEGYAKLKGYPETPSYGAIEQVAHSFAYLDANYAIANEKGVAIAESTCASKFKYESSPERLFEITELTRIALERAKSAREAVRIIGALAENYGYFDWGELLIIADQEEGWVFEICASPRKKGALWVAKKVPDGEVFVAANEFRIREIAPHDKDLMYAKELFEIAKEEGWLENGCLDWLKSVSPGEYNHPYYCLRRVWRLQDLINPALKLSPWVENGYTKAYPFSIKPLNKLAFSDVATLLRDYYQGSEFDLSQGLAAGPFGCPYRYRGPTDGTLNLPETTPQIGTPFFSGAWERPVAVYFCGYSHITEIDPSLPPIIGTLVWIGLGQPLMSCYIPFYVSGPLPESFSSGSTLKFSPQTAWWAFNFISNLAALKFCSVLEDVQNKQKKTESQECTEQETVQKQALKLWEKDPQKALEFLNSSAWKNSRQVVKEWWNFAYYLLEKYTDGSVNKPKPLQEVGYPVWWLKTAGYQKGPTEYQKKP